jgi:hypothetical protein
VAYYPFNGNANDGLNGTAPNWFSGSEIRWSSDRLGVEDSAIEILGGQSSIDYEVSDSFESVTISGWIRINSVEGMWYDEVSKRRATVPFNVSRIIPNTNPFNLMARFSIFTLDESPASIVYRSEFYSYDDGNLMRFDKDFWVNRSIESSCDWHQFIVTANSQITKFFVDGLYSGSANRLLNSSIKASGLRLHFGNEGVIHFNGKLDDFRIYNRALSDLEVGGLYNHERLPNTVITKQPSSVEGRYGDRVDLVFQVTNQAPDIQLNYQWYKDGAKLNGATNSSLSFEPILLEQIGSYKATVNDGSRTVSSLSANVTVRGVDSSIWKGLVASYPFENGINDIIGSKDDIVSLGKVEFVDEGYRSGSKSIRVHGREGFLAGTGRTWISGSQPRTVSVWVKPAIAFTNNGTVLSFGGIENCSQRFALQIPPTMQGVRFTGGDCSNAIRSKLFSGATISNKWTHIVLTYDGTSVRCFLNGLQAGSPYPVQLNTDSLGPIIVGNSVGIDNEGFSGLVDNIKIYNRSISSTEVVALYKSETGGSLPSLPEILAQPIPVMAAIGDSVKFSVQVSDSNNGFQWQKNGQVLASNVRLNGVNSSVLSISNCRIEDIGDYSVLVTNVFGSLISKPAGLSLSEAARSLTVSSVGEVQDGDTLAFPVSFFNKGGVGGFAFSLKYNPTYFRKPKMEWSSLIFENLNPLISVNTSVAGEVFGSLALAGVDMPVGNYSIGNLILQARSVPAKTDVSLEPQFLSVADSRGNPVISGNSTSPGSSKIIPRKVKGDNNANQRLDINDAAVISQMLINLEEVRPWDIPQNDINNTGELDNGDIIKALRAVVGLDPQPGPMGDAKRLSPALVMGLAPVSTNYSADLALLDGSAIKVGQPYRVAVRLKSGRGDLTGLSFSLKYPKSLELKDKVIGKDIPADAVPVWNVSGSRAKLAVIRPKAWAAQSGAVATFTFQPTPEAAKQTKLPISLEEVEVSDVGEGLSAVPSVWLEIGGGLEFAPQLRVMRTSADALSLEILGPRGLPLALESSEDLSAWSEIQSVSGQGIDAVISVNVTPPESVRAKFWRVTIK